MADRFQDLDLNKMPLGTLGTSGDIAAGEPKKKILPGLLVGRRRRALLEWRADELTTPGDVTPTNTVGQKAIMADPNQTTGKNVQEKSAKEVLGLQGQDFRAIALGPILPSESHTTVFERDDPIVGDRDSMGVAAQVIQHLVRPGHGRLGVDHPILARRRSKDGSDVMMALS